MASPQDQGVKPSSTAAAAAATASPLVADETIATREIGHLSLAPPLVFPLGVSAAAMAAHRAQDAEEEQGNGPMAPPPTRVSSCSSGAGQAGGGAQGASRASILDSLMGKCALR